MAGLPSTISECDDEEEEERGTGTGSTAGDSHHSHSSSTSDKSTKLHKNEESAVRKTRLLVLATVVTCALGIVLAVYFLAKQSDLRSFELEYDGFTTDIRALVRWEVRYNFALMEQLSAQITIANNMLNQSFPFHTEPQYEMTGGFVDGMGGIMSAAFAPLVTVDQREEWEQYSVDHQDWLTNSDYLKRVHPKHRDALHGTIQDHEHDRRRVLEQSKSLSEHALPRHRRRDLQDETEPAHEPISPYIYKYDENGNKIPETNDSPDKLFAPLWQVSPADAGVVNINLFADPRVTALYEEMTKVKRRVILSQSTEIGDMFDFLFDPGEKKFKKDPHGLMLGPVYTQIEEEEDQVLAGVIIGVTPFGNLLDRLLPEGADGIIGVFKDNCGDVMSFELNSGKALFLGYEDVHEESMEEYEVQETNLEMYEDIVEGLCAHDLHLYPTEKFRATYTSSHAGTYAAIFGVAAALGAIFWIYDMRVTRRQNKTMQSAMRSRAIVNSLFPEKIAREMVESPMIGERKSGSGSGGDGGNIRGGGSNNKYATFMSDGGRSLDSRNATKASKPLADLFPEATVMFGDLVGFTAWSSLREPHQVFILLETIYASFDEVAARRRVFKVETIGDCYVAVCGLPTPRKDHATTMARFASECCRNLPSVLRKLEIELGPDTSTLGIRIGLHSGPVTAGVLRGERARFQLFGDTVNTTSRIESTGEKNQVHISEETASQLIDSGKGHWVFPREDKVTAKGKGELQTFWLRLKGESAASTASSSHGSGEGDSDNEEGLDDETAMSSEKRLSAALKSSKDIQALGESEERFVSWVVDILSRHLKQISERRIAMGIRPDLPHRMKQAELNLRRSDRMTIDEVQDVIQLPKYDAKVDPVAQGEAETAELSPQVVTQLQNYVHTIACMYRDNPFHNYAHACHVLMSCSKLLSRIVSVEIEEDEGKILHDHTYGITSDPLTQFAAMLSALIHDMDHPGVPNMQLTKENDELAVVYKNKSTAEQHSVDAAWELLMEESYTDLRRAIYCNKEELVRFRQLTVNAVMATDIMDKQLGQQRKDRWNKAFSEEIINGSGSSSDQEDKNRKATIVIEHLIQASDVAHTMQHWHIYKKWNERLFRENYLAFKAGRAAKNPLDGWYEGEIGFFDYYIIPLAKKLKDCGVFGVSSDEYLSYAVQNRKEWVKKGKEVVEEFAEIVRKEYSS